MITNSLRLSADRFITEKLDDICAKIVKIRDKHRCQHYGKYVTGSDAHCSHVLPKSLGYYVRWDLINLKLLCMHGHLHWWHKNPTEAGKWFREKFPHRMKYLDNLKPNPLKKWSMACLRDLLAELQEKLSDLEKGD